MEKVPAGAPETDASPRILELSPDRSGQRLDLFLADRLGLSRAQVRRLLERGAVSLGGRRLALRDKGRPLPAVGALAVDAFRPPQSQRAPAETSAAVGPIPVEVGSGPGWLAVDKPAGMPVHPLQEAERGTVLGHLIDRHPEIHGVGEGGLRSGVVHRLDIGTSGVLLFATEHSVWQRLRTAFGEHRVDKRYRALVLGHFDPPGGEREIELPLVVARHRPARVRVATSGERLGGRARIVSQVVRLVEPLHGASLVEVRPRTGFLHQIRVTMAHLGHPVLGDRHYGGSVEDVARMAGADRHLLHAARVAFEEIVAEARDPEDFAACARRLRRG